MSKKAISNIVIALDQTEFSKKILHNALNFCSLISPKPIITCLHVAHFPYYSELGNAIIEDYKQFESFDIKTVNEVFFDHQKDRFKDFIYDNSEKENFSLNVKVIEETRTKPYHAIKEYIEKEKPDLLIMRTRSHTALDVFLLGSFVEKIISINDSIPMLIVK